MAVSSDSGERFVYPERTDRREALSREYSAEALPAADDLAQARKRATIATMTTVVLLGFSTAGKSSILRAFKDRYGDDLETIDTDESVASRHRGHIYNIFIEMTEGGDTMPALRYIERKEDEVLKSIKESILPRLIAAGPWVPVRDEWEPFVTRVSPICFYLQKTVQEVYKGLKDRRKRHRAQGVNESKVFGCWDEGIMSRHQVANGKHSWPEMSPKSAVPKIKVNLDHLEQTYKRYAEGRVYRIAHKEVEEPLYQEIALSLGLPPFGDLP